MTIAQFVFYTVVNVPINCYWQDWLEATFPGSTAAPVNEAEAKEKKKAGKPVEAKKAVNVQNILIKFVCDQTIGAAFNIPLFLASIGLAKGQGVDQIISTIQKVSSPASHGITTSPNRRAGCAFHLHCGRQAVAGGVADQLHSRAGGEAGDFRQPRGRGLEHVPEPEGGLRADSKLVTASCMVRSRTDD
jgi:hypothetical protein